MATRQDQLKYWQTHISAWEQSGTSQAGYCRTHNLKIKNFAYWLRKLRKGSETIKLVQISGVPVVAVPLRLIIDDRFAIEVDDRFSPDTLKQLVLTVRGL